MEEGYNINTAVDTVLFVRSEVVDRKNNMTVYMVSELPRQVAERLHYLAENKIITRKKLDLLRPTEASKKFAEEFGLPKSPEETHSEQLDLITDGKYSKWNREYNRLLPPKPSGHFDVIGTWHPSKLYQVVEKRDVKVIKTEAKTKVPTV